MKNLRNLILISLAFLGSTGVYAQSDGKFGHINSTELISAMPESDSAQTRIESLAREYELQLEEMNVELNKKYDEYLTKRDSYTELIRQTGLTYNDVEKSGVHLPLIEEGIKFLKPAHYDDILSVKTIVEWQKGVRVRFKYEILRNE